jgi:hypothetical protein
LLLGEFRAYLLDQTSVGVFQHDGGSHPVVRQGDPALMLRSILVCAPLGTVGFVLALSGTPLAA